MHSYRLPLLYERLVILLYSLTIIMGLFTNLLLIGAFLTNEVTIAAIINNSFNLVNFNCVRTYEYCYVFSEDFLLMSPVSVC